MQTEKIIFSEELQSALDIAAKIAHEHKHAEYTPAHLLKAILHRDLSLLKELEAMGKDVYYLEEWAEVRIDEFPKTPVPKDVEPHISIDDVISEADAIRDILDREEIDLLSVMIAISTPGVGFNFDQMKSFPISRAELLDERVNQTSVNTDLLNLPTERNNAKLIYKYCTNLTALAKNNKSPREIVAREKELKEIVEILCRFSKPNVLLQGYPGTGKTALIHGFVDLIVNRSVPERLLDTEVFELNMGTLLAGASYRGEIEERLKKIITELKFYPKVILVIDGIHVLLDKNSDNAGISSILKAELSKGLTLIATTTVDEFTKKIEKDEGLSNLFEVIKVDEPNDDNTFRILKSSLTKFKEHHGIEAEDETLREAIRLSKRYLKEKSLPESALNLLDRTMSVIKTSGDTFLKEKNKLSEKIEAIKLMDDEKQQQESMWLLEDLKKKAHFLLTQEKLVEDTHEMSISEIETLIARLTEIANIKKEHIEPIDLGAIVAQKTGIPLGKLKSGEKERLQNMEEVLQKRVVGQDLAINIVTEAVLESRSGLSKAGQPIGSFFFLGPTGTGKTELAKSLADFLFQDENAIIRFDMSEFKEEHSAALLYGAPPGYVGYEEGGLLVNKIRQKPYSIVLFDEIEKAHPSVFDVFLQILDEGKLHDRLGKEGDFSNAMILFTSNIGSQFIVESITSGKGHPSSNQLMEIMAGHFRPEFLGRLTEIIPFGPITKENATGIFEIHLKKELLDLLKQLEMEIEITQEAKSFLVDNGFNATYGARPLKGIIRSELRRPLSRKIISGEAKEGSKIKVDVKDGELNWEMK
jgi:ATP-dependent Clp protease ATP-binding subunit ClpB